uniref:Putative secreted peptide n=1 Tax=Anopheles braziliensis TaxID=58242 RepID=A0A2M3ZQX3_9DIPT
MLIWWLSIFMSNASCSRDMSYIAHSSMRCGVVLCLIQHGTINPVRCVALQLLANGRRLNVQDSVLISLWWFGDANVQTTWA